MHLLLPYRFLDLECGSPASSSPGDVMSQEDLWVAPQTAKREENGRHKDTPLTSVTN
jgi:hypothetical protein